MTWEVDETEHEKRDARIEAIKSRSTSSIEASLQKILENICLIETGESMSIPGWGRIREIKDIVNKLMT